MSRTTPNSSVPEDDAAFIAEAMQCLRLASDAQLEALANLARYTLSKARQGAQPLGAWNRAKILDLQDYPGIRDAILAIFAKKGREWIELDRRRQVRGADPLNTKRRRTPNALGVE